MFLGREQLPRRMQNKMQATLLLPTGYSKIRFRSDCGWYPNVIKWGLWGGFLCIDILHTRVQCSKHRGFFIAAMCKVSKVLHHVVGQGNREKFDGEIKLSFFSKNESSLSFWGCLCSKFYVWKGNFDVSLGLFYVDCWFALFFALELALHGDVSDRVEVFSPHFVRSCISILVCIHAEGWLVVNWRLVSLRLRAQRASGRDSGGEVERDRARKLRGRLSASDRSSSCLRYTASSLGAVELAAFIPGPPISVGVHFFLFRSFFPLSLQRF